MVSYSISLQAYVKVFLHAAKHHHQPVNGVLLGKRSSDTVLIEDVIPLLHHWTSLSPMMEVGLDLAQGHAESQGLIIVGYYQACERLDDTSLAPVGEKIASKIRENFKDAVAFVIDGSKLTNQDVAWVPFLPSLASSWRPYTAEPPPFTTGSPFSLVNHDSPSCAIEFVSKGLHHKFGDFDDHLEDVTIDWLRNRDCNVSNT